MQAPAENHAQALRRQTLLSWLQQALGHVPFTLEPASSDASFRQYFRVRYGDNSLIVMDAPPEHEDCRPFVHIARLFLEIGLHVPKILAQDLERGFLLLSDLGTTLMQDALDEHSVARLYGDALGALLMLQARGPRDGTLPPYDQALLMREMRLFPEWFLERHLHITLTASQQEAMESVYLSLAHSALEQPRVCVHRDYHSRNLLVTERNNPGIVDFQDAVVGPVTYDLVSLLRDCYIDWPKARVEDWALGYRQLAHRSGILQEEDEAQFLRWFDLMGVQRHLKALGIFARLHHRDGKPGYLNALPRTLGYVLDVTARYAELDALHGIAFQAANALR